VLQVEPLFCHCRLQLESVVRCEPSCKHRNMGPLSRYVYKSGAPRRIVQRCTYSQEEQKSFFIVKQMQLVLGSPRSRT
jgi:hypothetical protein